MIWTVQRSSSNLIYIFEKADYMSMLLKIEKGISPDKFHQALP